MSVVKNAVTSAVNRGWHYKMIYIGYGIFALVLGYFIGASNTPVVASFFAVVAALLGTIFGVIKIEVNSPNQKKLNLLGVLISIFSTSLLIGAIIGEKYRNYETPIKQKIVPWEGRQAPSNTYEALDWIITAKKLSALGYNTSQIAELYEIRLVEKARLERIIAQEKESRNDYYPSENTVIYNQSNPFHTMLPDNLTAPKKSPERGPASETGN